MKNNEDSKSNSINISNNDNNSFSYVNSNNSYDSNYVLLTQAF